MNLLPYSTRRRSQTRQLPNISGGGTFPQCLPNRGQIPMTIIDGTIFDILDKQPFSSVQELAKLTCNPTMTVS
jgi:hypothetical protein